MEFSGLDSNKVRILHMDGCNFSSIFHFTIDRDHIFSGLGCRGGLYCNCTWELHFATMCLCIVLKTEKEKNYNLCSRELKTSCHGDGRKTDKQEQWDTRQPEEAMPGSLVTFQFFIFACFLEHNFFDHQKTPKDDLTLTCKELLQNFACKLVRRNQPLSFYEELKQAGVTKNIFLFSEK